MRGVVDALSFFFSPAKVHLVIRESCICLGLGLCFPASSVSHIVLCVVVYLCKIIWRF